MPTSRKRIAKKRINKYSEPSVLQFAPPQNFNITSHLTFGAIVALKQDLIFSTEVKAVTEADLLLCSSLILPLLPTRSHILAQGQCCGMLFFPQVEAATAALLSFCSWVIVPLAQGSISSSDNNHNAHTNNNNLIIFLE